MASVSKRKWTYKGSEKEAWIVRWTEPNGGRGQKTFKMKKDADRYRLKVEAEKESGTHVAKAAQRTVAEVCDLFVAHTDRRREDGHIGRTRRDQIERVIRLHIKPVLGRKVWTELAWRDVENWSTHMAEHSRCSPQTRRVYLEILNEIEQYALKRDMTKKRVVSEYSSDAGSVGRKIIRTFTAAEVQHLLRTAESRVTRGRHRSHLMLRCAVNLAAFCGLRRGEIFGLTRGSINHATRTLRIRHSLTVHDEHKGPKTASGKRDVPMPSHVAALLREWEDEFFVANDRDLLFRNADGQMFYAANFMSACWRPLLQRAGLWQEDGDQYHFHALRHFAASWMIENGLSLPDVAALLGHSKFDMTLQVYAHPIIGGSHRHDALDRMAGSLLRLDGATASQEVLTP